MSDDDKTVGELTESLEFDDSVWARVVQIIQEAMLTGIDCTDLLRQVRVQHVVGTNRLELTPEYVEFVKKGHEKMIAEAELMRSATRPIGQG